MLEPLLKLPNLGLINIPRFARSKNATHMPSVIGTGDWHRTRLQNERFPLLSGRSTSSSSVWRRRSADISSILATTRLAAQILPGRALIRSTRIFITVSILIAIIALISATTIIAIMSISVVIIMKTAPRSAVALIIRSMEAARSLVSLAVSDTSVTIGRFGRFAVVVRALIVVAGGLVIILPTMLIIALVVLARVGIGIGVGVGVAWSALVARYVHFDDIAADDGAVERECLLQRIVRVELDVAVALELVGLLVADHAHLHDAHVLEDDVDVALDEVVRQVAHVGDERRLVGPLRHLWSVVVVVIVTVGVVVAVIVTIVVARLVAVVVVRVLVLLVLAGRLVARLVVGSSLTLAFASVVAIVHACRTHFQ